MIWLTVGYDSTFCISEIIDLFLNLKRIFDKLYFFQNFTISENYVTIVVRFKYLI